LALHFLLLGETSPILRNSKIRAAERFGLGGLGLLEHLLCSLAVIVWTWIANLPPLECTISNKTMSGGGRSDIFANIWKYLAADWRPQKGHASETKRTWFFPGNQFIQTPLDKLEAGVWAGFIA